MSTDAPGPLSIPQILADEIRLLHNANLSLPTSENAKAIALLAAEYREQAMASSTAQQALALLDRQ